MPLCRDTGRDAWMASPVVVRHEGDGRWRLLPASTAEVHLAVLFRDPPVRGERRVERVLDLKDRADAFTACATCWVRALLEEVGPVPAGLAMALDNGVRCGGESQLGWDASDEPSVEEFAPWARCCLGRTRAWLDGLRHPDGGAPGVLVADELLAQALAGLGALTRDDGSPWTPRGGLAETVGDRLRVLGRRGLLLAHPRSVQRWRKDLGQPIRRAVPVALALARLPAPAAPGHGQA